MATKKPTQVYVPLQGAELAAAMQTMVVSTPTVTRFNKKYGVLVDEQGIMLPRSNVLALLEECQKHLSVSALELEAIGRRTVVDNHPSMEKQFNFEGYFE